MTDIDQSSEAIVSAKQMRQPGEGGDGGLLVPFDQVLLIELCWALEILVEPRIDRSPLSTEYVDWVYKYVLDTLQSGKLIAYTLAENALIGRASWPKPKDGETEYNMSFYHPVIGSDRDCRGHVGSTPVVPLKKAVEWLRASKEPTIKHETPEREQEAYQEFIAHYIRQEIKATNEDHKDWAAKNSVSHTRVFDLKRAFAPDSWRNPGAPLKNK